MNRFHAVLIFVFTLWIPLLSFGESHRIAIVVNSSLKDAISENLKVYISDLKREGYDPVSISWDLDQSSTPRSLKDKLVELYSEADSLQGAVLIGDLPIPLMPSYVNDTITSFSESPYYIADLYYMDLIGKEWDELRSSKKFSNYFDSAIGNVTSDQEINLKYLLKKTKANRNSVPLDDLFPEVEIWVSRMPVSTLSVLGSEGDLINNYLEKNHAYRNKKVIFPKQALVYFDPEDKSLINEEIHVLKNSYDTTVLTPNSQNEFLRPLTKYDSEIFAWRRHGHPYAILVETDKSILRNDAFLVSSEVIEYSKPITTAFIFALSCNIGAYTTKSYFAGAMQFRESSFVLATSTGTTPMFGSSSVMGNCIKDFINGDNFGQAFKKGINKLGTENCFLGLMPLKDTNYIKSRAKGRNGRYILGDGTLKLQQNSNHKELSYRGLAL